MDVFTFATVKKSVNFQSFLQIYFMSVNETVQILQGSTVTQTVLVGYLYILQFQKSAVYRSTQPSITKGG